MQNVDSVPENTGDLPKVGKMAKGPFAHAIADFYLSNPIARASALMAELSAGAAARRAAPMAAE